jgi:hypothetical protein
LKLIYIAGAYRSRSLLGVVRNIFRARLVERKRRSDGSGNACGLRAAVSAETSTGESLEDILNG